MREIKNDVLINKTFKNIALKGGIILFYILISVIFNKKVSKLSLVTSQGLFGSDVSYWSLMYFLLLIFSLIFFMTVLGIMYYGKYIKPLGEKVIKVTYQIYDFISFALITLTTFFVCIMFIFTPCTVNGSSMNNTYFHGDKLIIWHLGYQPKCEDVVVVFTDKDHYNQITDMFILKRIVAQGGDEIKYIPFNELIGDLFINDVLVQEKITLNQFKILTSAEDVDNKYTIPMYRYLVLGDNRGNSTDSRVIGLVYKEDILGKVILRTYPFDKMGNPDKSIK